MLGNFIFSLKLFSVICLWNLFPEIFSKHRQFWLIFIFTYTFFIIPSTLRKKSTVNTIIDRILAFYIKIIDSMCFCLLCLVFVSLIALCTKFFENLSLSMLISVMLKKKECTFDSSNLATLYWKNSFSSQITPIFLPLDSPTSWRGLVKYWCTFQPTCASTPNVKKLPTSKKQRSNEKKISSWNELPKQRIEVKRNFEKYFVSYGQ